MNYSAIETLESVVHTTGNQNCDMDYQKIEKLLLEYLNTAIRRIRKIAYSGKGREILGDIVNRPEDIEIGIDRVGEKILAKLVKKHKLDVSVFSETVRGSFGNGKDKKMYGALDPFDGSIFFLKGFNHNWYTVLSFFDENRQPTCCGAGDIIDRKIYFSGKEGNFVLDLKSGKKERIFPSKTKDFSQNFVLASYISSSRYSAKFLNHFGGLLKEMHPRALFYPQGGSFVYAFLAAGLIDAYVMFDEPRSEIDPGFCMAKKANCPVVSVAADGSWQDYEFLPEKQHEKVDLLIAAANPEIRDKLINHYLSKNN